MHLKPRFAATGACCSAPALRAWPVHCANNYALYIHSRLFFLILLGQSGGMDIDAQRHGDKDGFQWRTVMTTSASTLNELIEITRDGQNFYTDAVTHVRSSLLKAVFHGIIDAKAQLIRALSEHVRVRGELPSPKGT